LVEKVRKIYADRHILRLMFFFTSEDHCPRGVTRGDGDKEGIILRAPNPYGRAELLLEASKSPNDVTSTFFHAVNLLPKELRFDHGGAKLASCPGPHLTSLRPCTVQACKAVLNT